MLDFAVKFASLSIYIASRVISAQTRVVCGVESCSAMGWFGDLRRTWAPACLAVAIAAATSACGPDGPRVPDVVDHINSIDLTPRFPSSPESSGRPAQSPRPVSYVGTEAGPIRRV